MLKRSVQYFMACFLVLPVSMATFADYSKHEKALPLIEELVNDHGFDRNYLISVLKAAERKDNILEAIARPAEKRLEWFEYRRIFITQSRIEKGKAFIQAHLSALEKAEQQFGVPKEIISSIIGVETRYGQNKGSFRVIDALTTLGFDYPPRSKFFSSELKQAFLLSREQGFDILKMKGSYAGAMGYGQFISSSYRHYAIDFDGDQIVDILDNVTDAIGSVANYFAEHKWKAGQPIAILLSGENSKEAVRSFYSKSLKPSFLLSDMQKAGLSIPRQLDINSKGKIQNYVLETGDQDWLTLDNFYTITRYNHSHLYAMAVYELAKELGLEQ